MRRILTTLCVVVLAACGAPEHQNKFDPGTPPALQARATLTGALSLEAEGAAAPTLAGVEVSVPSVGQVTTDDTGAWSLPSVPPGTWTVQFHLDRYDDLLLPGVVVTLDDGDKVVSVPPVALKLSRGGLTGRVVLEGEPAAAGVTVTLSGRPGAVSTDVAGLFQLGGVPVGTYAVTASRPGFDDAVLPAVTIAAGLTSDAGVLTLAARPGSVAGLVVVQGAASQAGVTVRVAGTTLAGSAWSGVTLSAEDGSYLLPGVPAGQYNVTFELLDHGTVASAVAVSPDGAATLPPVTLTRNVGALLGVVQLSGVVAPFNSAGVRVLVQGTGLTTTTDGAGGFLLTGVPVGTYTVAALLPPDWQPVEVSGVTITTGAVTTLPGSPLSLAPVASASLGGAVLLENGGGPAGTTVTLSGSDFRGVAATAVTTTGATGAFGFSGLRAGSYQLALSRAGHDAPAPLSVSVASGQAVDVGTSHLALSRGELVGQVALEGETSAAGVTVALSGGAGAAVTDLSGAYRLSGVPVGSYVLTASRTGFGDAQLLSVTVGANQVTVVQALVLPALPGAIAGTVQVVGAADSAGVTVRADGSTLSGARWAGTTTTPASGAFLLSGVPAGTYNVTFERTDYATASTSVAVAPSGTATLPPVSLGRDTGGVTGTATLEGSSDSSGLQVSLTPLPTAADPSPAAAAAAITDASGTWRVDVLPVGTYVVGYQKTGYLAQTGTVTVVSHAVISAAPVQLAAIPGAVRGSVRLEGLAAGALGGTSVRLEGGSLSTTTLADGSYLLSGVGAGAQTVLFTRTGYDDQRVQVVLGPGDTVSLFEVTLAISRGALSGTFTLPLATSSAGVVVTATGPGGASATTVTDGSGAFSLTGLPVGSYGLTARKDPEWQQASVAGLVVAAGATTSTGAPVALNPLTTAGITGTVALEGGAAAAGTTATLSGADFRGATVSATTPAGAGGVYAFTGLPAGTYQVVLSRAGYETPAPLAAAVSTGQQVSLGAVSLARSRGAVDGVVLLSGVVAPSNSAGVRVSLRGTTFVALTDASGAFSIAGVPVGTYVLDAALAPDWVGASVAGLVVARDLTTTVAGSPLTLSPVATGSVAGTATLEGGAAPAGTTVTLTGTDFRGVPVSTATVTGATGGYTFSGLVAGSYQVTFSRTDYETPAPLGASVGTAQAVLLGGVQLARSRGAIGGVVSLSGVVAPATSAGVMVALQGTAFSALTGADGSFTLTGVPVGTYTVTAALPPDWQGASVAGVAVTRDGTTLLPGSPLTLAPYATATVGGTATLEVLGAVAGTDVALAGTDFRGVAVSRTTTTAALGAFSFPGLAAGSYQVTVSRAGYVTPAPAGVSVVTGQGATLGNLALAAARGGASGTVVATGAADQSGTVVTVSGGPDSASTVTDASGAWAVAGLRVGTGYSASYQRTAYATGASLPFAVTVGATTAVASASLSLATSGSIAGAVAVERGAATGVTVTLSGTDLNGAAVTRATTSATAGAWSLTGLPHGTYGLTFSKPGYEARSLAGLAVGSGALAAATVTLPVATGTIAGSATLSAGAIAGFSVGSDHSGIVVTLSGADVPVASAVTNSLGDYRIENVPVSLSGAPYQVTASKPWYQAQVTSVTAAAAATVVAGPLSLVVDAGGLFGLATSTNVLGGGDKLDSAGTTITVTGAAFNGTSYSAVATTGADGAWATDLLPPGSYDVVATATGRVCEPYARVAAEPGKPMPAGDVICLDALPPTGLVLGAPAVVPPQLAGYTAATSVDVPVTTPALDPSSPENLSGYELAVGAVPYWPKSTFVAAKETRFFFDGLTPDARNVLWARPIDLAGNVGQEVSVEVIQDSIDPDRPTLTTARPVVDATTATVTFSGSEGDANFLRYEVATATQGPTTACDPTTAGAFSATTGSTALNVSENMKTCVWGRAVDRAGRISPQQVISVLSDLSPPTSPTIAPLYDPSLVTIHAEYADFFVTDAATDGPAGGSTPWKDVAWVEVDTGSGYRPLCPQAACRASGVFDPCGACACGDARLVCDGGQFKAIRVALLDGTGNSVGIRAVDLAGNVGSGASQVVNTTTSLFEVEVGAQAANVPRGRGRLMGYRFDNTLRLRDLGEDGRPDPGDVACDVGAMVNVVPELAVLSPSVVVHAAAVFTTEWESQVQVRRPGAAKAFCAVDDATYTLYRLPASSGSEIFHLTGSLNSTFRSEYAAWVERNTSTFVDTIKVQAPNSFGRLGTNFTVLPFTIHVPPAPVALFTLPSGTNVADLLMGGDCLLTQTTAASFRVDCKAGGLGTSVGSTSWGLPGTAFAASLSADGALLGWAEGVAGGTRLHVRSAGKDKLFGTVDDADTTRLVPGTVPWNAEAALDLGHFVLSETGTPTGTYWFQHWSAGPDGVFDGSATADDTAAKVLPSSKPRPSPSVLAGGVVAWGIYGDGVNLADVLASDLSTYRWEASEAHGFYGLTSNDAGTLFFSRGGVLTARKPNGTEEAGTSVFTSTFAASGANLITAEGGAWLLRRRTAGGSWFSGTPVTLYGATVNGLAAGDQYGLAMFFSGSSRYLVSDLSAATPSATLLPVIPGTTPGNNGWGVSAQVVAYQCLSAGWGACFHQPGTDATYGTGDDVTGVLKAAGGTGAEYAAYGLAVSGDKIVFMDGSGNLTVVAAGADGRFNTSDDEETLLGTSGSGSANNIDVGGQHVAWLHVGATGGIEVWTADLRTGVKRQVTDHYSMKEQLLAEPSGRIHWIDYVFSAPAIFVSAQ